MNEKVGIVGAVSAAVLASICCIGPVVLAGLGMSAVAAAQAFAPYRPLFLAITVAFLAAGFYFAYRRPKQKAGCAGEVCEAPRIARWGRPLLWLATVLVIVLVAFPYYYAPLRVVLNEPPAPAAATMQAANLATVDLTIGGMTCEGCAGVIRSKLLQTPGVFDAQVVYPEGTAQVMFDPAKTDAAKLAAVVKSLGYQATPARD